MKQNQGAFSALIAIQLVIVVLLTLSACTAVAPEEQQEPASPASESAAVTKLVPEETGGPTGLEIPLDGSSLKAFDESLAKVQRNSSETDYTTLESAIDYLLLYDIGLNRDREKLAKKLDGMTGQEILDQVNLRRR